MTQTRFSPTSWQAFRMRISHKKALVVFLERKGENCYMRVLVCLVKVIGGLEMNFRELHLWADQIFKCFEALVTTRGCTTLRGWVSFYLPFSRWDKSEWSRNRLIRLCLPMLFRLLATWMIIFPEYVLSYLGICIKLGSYTISVELPALSSKHLVISLYFPMI